MTQLLDRVILGYTTNGNDTVNLSYINEIALLNQWNTYKLLHCSGYD